MKGSLYIAINLSNKKNQHTHTLLLRGLKKIQCHIDINWEEMCFVPLPVIVRTHGTPGFTTEFF